MERTQELRLHELEEPHGAGLRLRHLEARRAGQKGEVDAETAREMVAARRDQRGAGGARRSRIGDCPTPGCGGQIVENSRAYGCTSWKSRKNPGCGFVIWKRERGATAR